MSAFNIAIDRMIEHAEESAKADLLINLNTGMEPVMVWNAAVDAVVAALKSRERLFRSKVEGEMVLNDLLKMKVE